MLYLAVAVSATAVCQAGQRIYFSLGPADSQTPLDSQTNQVDCLTKPSDTAGLSADCTHGAHIPAMSELKRPNHGTVLFTACCWQRLASCHTQTLREAATWPEPTGQHTQTSWYHAGRQDGKTCDLQHHAGTDATAQSAPRARKQRAMIPTKLLHLR